MGYIEHGKSEGANLLAGGGPAADKGYFIQVRYFGIFKNHKYWQYSFYANFSKQIKKEQNTRSTTDKWIKCWHSINHCSARYLFSILVI